MKSIIMKCAVVLSVFLSACTKVTIETPESGAVYPDTVPDFNASWDQDPITPLKYTLNGVNVTNLFVEGEGNTSSAAAADLTPYLIDGKNVFSITSAPTVSFYYDISGPRVHITSVTGSDPLLVEGYVEDPVGVASLAIDGNSIVLSEEQTFSTSLPYQSSYDFSATDMVGHVNEDDFAERGSEAAPGIMAKVNGSGLPSIADLVNQQIADIDLTALLQEFNPIFDEGLLGTTAVLNVTEVTTDAPLVDLGVAASNNNSLDITVEMPNFTTFVDAEGTLVFIPWTSSGDISADNAVFDVSASVSVVDGEFSVAINNIDADLQGFSFDIENFPDALESLVDIIVKPLVELLVSNKLEEAIPEKIEEVVAGLIPSLTIVLNDSAINVQTIPATFNALNQAIDLSLNNNAAVLFVDEHVPRVLGSVFVDAPTPSIGTQTPSGLDFDFATGISINFFNQILLGAYEGGIFNIVMENPTADGGMNRIEITPASAPFLSLVNSEAALGKLEMLDFDLVFSSRAAEEIEFEPIFGATLNLKAPFNLGVDEEQKLAFSLNALPEIQVLDVQEEGSVQVSPEFVQAALDIFMPLVLPSLTQGLDGFDMPSLEGSGLDLKQIWVDDNRSFILIAGDLVVNPTEEEGPAAAQ